MTGTEPEPSSLCAPCQTSPLQNPLSHTLSCISTQEQRYFCPRDKERVLECCIVISSRGTQIARSLQPNWPRNDVTRRPIVATRRALFPWRRVLWSPLLKGDARVPWSPGPARRYCLKRTGGCVLALRSVRRCDNGSSEDIWQCVHEQGKVIKICALVQEFCRLCQKPILMKQGRCPLQASPVTPETDDETSGHFHPCFDPLFHAVKRKKFFTDGGTELIRSSSDILRSSSDVYPFALIAHSGGAR